MERSCLLSLSKWAKKKGRKPLILNGARQIGKSWVVRNLGKTEFQNQYVELNFEKNPNLIQIFETDLDVKRIIAELEIQLNTQINEHTLLFLDEVQFCPKAIMSLRYFYEDYPQLPVIAAGSLLEFQLQNIPFPVGRVEILQMYPMTFEEFLMARGQKHLVAILNGNFSASISAIIEDKLYAELLNYYWVGGMPECVQAFVNSNDYVGVRKIQEDLLYTFYQDFGKYNPLVNKTCLLDVLNNLSHAIGAQVIYSKLSEGFSNPTIKKGVEVLATAKIIHTIQNVSASGLPFIAGGKQFKASFLDIGLLLCISKTSFESVFYPSQLLANFTGPWAEQFVAQQLLANGNNPLYYWARTQTNSSAEVDFMIESKGNIVPIEVKSGKTGKLRSLHLLLKEYPNIQAATVYSKTNAGIEGKIHFIPIYLAGKYVSLESLKK